ncbi:MAG TPA: M23 family metallopeptidase [Thermoanaerobaculia bacterium]|nr:M23 family metallopeptidase [Thermoanaerobaculia bacterium]
MAQRSRLPWLVLALLVAGLLAYLVATGFSLPAAPVLSLHPTPKGIGRHSETVVTVEAPAGSLASVSAELVQQGKSLPLGNLSLPTASPWSLRRGEAKKVELPLQLGKDAHPELVPGQAVLRITATPAGTWLRQPAPVVSEFSLPVAFSPPELGVSSTQNNVAQGGSEVVVYHVGASASRDGVAAGDWFFPGYPLPGGSAGDRFCLFAAPYDLGDPAKIRLVAEDALGNRSERAFVDRFTARPLHTATLEVNDAFLSRVVPEILSQTQEVTDQGDLLQSYLVINRDLRKKNNQQLAHLAESSEPRFLWASAFRQLPNSAVMAHFADRRTYVYGGKPIDQQDHLGFDLASHQHAPVAAANRGKVVFAGPLGIYGNAVVLDHGYGLASLYAHLSKIDVAVGQEVEPGAALGLTGATGLAGGDHLHFSILIQGLAVSPVEWWDAKWIRDHLKAKLGNALPFAE